MRIFVTSVHARYTGSLRASGVLAKTGAVTVVQRTSTPLVSITRIGATSQLFAGAGAFHVHPGPSTKGF